MLFNRSKKITNTALLVGLTDIHSHILPGVDDGVQSSEEAIAILEWYEQLGIRKSVFTPHIMDNYPLNNAQMLREKFSVFKEIYKGGVELELAAEYMLDSQFWRHMESGDILTIIDDNHILVEASYLSEPIDFIGSLKEIMSRGYFVILAHPERYLYLEMEDYNLMKNLGVKFQLNIPSLLGGYGETIRKRAIKMIKRGMYEYLGTDIHSHRSHNNLFNNRKVDKSIINLIKKI